MKYQVLFLSEHNTKYSRMSSAAGQLSGQATLLFLSLPHFVKRKSLLQNKQILPIKRRFCF